MAEQGSGLAHWALVPLRLLIGYGFIAHGLAKLTRGPDLFAATLHGLAVPAPHVMAWLTILIELAGGAAVAAGAFLPVMSVPLIAVMAVAIAKVHWSYGFSSIKLVAVTQAGPQFGPPGTELPLLYIAAVVTLLMSGPSPWSVDRYRAGRRRR